MTFLQFVDGNAFSADDANTIMQQTVMRFSTTSQLTTQLGSGIRETGMMAWADDTGIMYMFDGTNWIPWFSPEKSYSAAFTAGVAVTVGNATVVSKYRYTGGHVKVTWSFTVGSTSNMQSGNYAWGLPVSIHTDFTNSYLGQLSFWDASASVIYHRAVVNISNQNNAAAIAEAGTRFSTASPVAPATGDIIMMSLLYRPATTVNL